jgi:hypothetical protein
VASVGLDGRALEERGLDWRGLEERGTIKSFFEVFGLCETVSSLIAVAYAA